MKLSGLLHRSRPELPGLSRHRPRRPAHRCAAAPRQGRARSPCSTRSTSTAPPPTRSSPPGSPRVVNAVAVDLRAVPEPGAGDPRRRRASRWSTTSAPRSCTRSRTAAGSGCTRASSTPGSCELGRGRRADRRLGRRRAGRGQVRAHPPARGVRRQHHRVHAPGAGAAARRRRRARASTSSWPDRQVLVVAAGLRPRRRAGAGSRPTSASTGRCWSASAPGADALLAAGHRPHLIVGDPAEISNEALTCGADVVVPGVRRRARPRPAPRAGPRRGRGHVPEHRPTPRTWRCCWRPTTARRWSSPSGCRRPWPSSSTAAARAATPRRSSPGCRSAAPSWTAG